MEATKMVMGYFGKERPITRDDYVSRWKNHAMDAASLANTSDEYAEIRAFADYAAELAGKQWDRMKEDRT